jgi:hypothetical protein
MELLDGTVEGRHCYTFDYFAKNLITITTEEEMMQREMRRVRKMKQGRQWVGKRTLSPDDAFEDDCITTICNIADTTKTNFVRHGMG